MEAGGSLAPGQHAFCAKICSNIITAQFCIVLLNNETVDGRETPNANVHMEYGLMLGFNKYVIPFQRESQKLPFNVAGLDTIKYTEAEFERLAADAVDKAVEATSQDGEPVPGTDQILEAFLLSKDALISQLSNEGDRDFYNLGKPLSFCLLNDFTGMTYIFLGDFSSLRAEAVLWRLRKLCLILDARRTTIGTRLAAGTATPAQLGLAQQVFQQIQVWLVVSNADAKRRLLQGLDSEPVGYEVQAFSLEDMRSELQNLMADMGA